jgi:hypothetical protein
MMFALWLALAIVLVMLAILGWEAYALMRKHREWTVTYFVVEHPHASILIALLCMIIFAIFGYTLRR